MGLCPDCQVAPGELHKPDCCVERCPECGGQRITCECETERPRDLWSGEWPNTDACRELNLWCCWVEGEGWVSCSKDHPAAREDLNTLLRNYRFNPEKKTWVKN
jgi:hypothetical protein